MSSDGGGGNNGGGAAGPCGACKFLRRKCVKGCIFAPYFDSDQGTAHFAAVHKIFGASNASKLLLRIPPHKRLDAVVSLCYEALARVKDPVYGSVAHIFTLQQQVVNLQAELSYTQARLSTLQRLPHHLPQPQDDVVAPENNVRGTNSSCLCSSSSISTSMPVVHFDDEPQGLVSVVEPSLQAPSQESMGRCHIDDVDDDDGDGDANDVDHGELQALAREFVSRFLPQPRGGGGVIFKPPSSN